MFCAFGNLVFDETHSAALPMLSSGGSGRFFIFVVDTKLQICPEIKLSPRFTFFQANAVKVLQRKRQTEMHWPSFDVMG
jgi:hypothetical protein